MEIRKIILCKQSPRTMRVASVEGSNAWPKHRKRCFLWTKTSKHEKSQTPLHYMNACVGARFAIKNVTRQNRENMNRWNQRKKLPSSERVLSVMYASRKDQKKHVVPGSVRADQRLQMSPLPIPIDGHESLNYYLTRSKFGSCCLGFWNMKLHHIQNTTKYRGNYQMVLQAFTTALYKSWYWSR